MANHENRSKRSAVGGSFPKAEAITAARERVEDTQDEMADTIYSPVKTLRNWEQGRNPMPPSAFEFYLLVTGQYSVENITDVEGKPGMSLLHLRTDDGRLIKMKIRVAELARLCRPAKAA